VAVEQFGLDPQPTSLDIGIDVDTYLPYVGFLLWGIVLVLGLVAVLFIARAIVRSRQHGRSASFKSSTLLITLPKFRHETESDRGESKDAIQESVSTAEMFFASIGGLKAQKGIKSWFFSRTDEFAFELIVEQKLIKFYVTVPKKSKITICLNQTVLF